MFAHDLYIEFNEDLTLYTIPNSLLPTKLSTYLPVRGHSLADGRLKSTNIDMGSCWISLHVPVSKHLGLAPFTSKILRSSDIIAILLSSLGYRKLSVRLRKTTIPTRSQMAMLCRIGCVRYVRLLFPFVGGEVVRPPPATGTSMSQPIDSRKSILS